MKTLAHGIALMETDTVSASVTVTDCVGEVGLNYLRLSRSTGNRGESVVDLRDPLRSRGSRGIHIPRCYKNNYTSDDNDDSSEDNYNQSVHP